MDDGRPSVMVISGSPRAASHSRALADAVIRACGERRMPTTLWALDEAGLPFADPRYHHRPADHPLATVKRFVASADEADSFILVTPVYHNSYSGALKNALDLLSMEQFRYKPVGLAGHGGARSTQAVDHLRIVVRGLLGVAIPTQVCTAAEDYTEGAGSPPSLTSPAILARVDRFAGELLAFATMARALRPRTAAPPLASE